MGMRWAIAVLLCGLPLAAADLDAARKLYDRTDYQGSLNALKSLPDKTAGAQFLAGKSWFMLGEFKKSAEAFEHASKLEPKNAVYVHWLGKATGRRAETAFVLAQPGLAVKTRQYFEKAVELDPRNTEALNDLFEFYLIAPGVMGGGVDKARALAERIEKVDAAEGHFVRAKLAEKAKELDTAEDHLRRAVEAAPRQVGRLIDLARFQFKRGRTRDAEQTFARAEKVAPNDPKLIYARAETYVKAKTNLDQARVLLRQYLGAPITPDDPPRADAEKLLREIGG